MTRSKMAAPGLAANFLGEALRAIDGPPAARQKHCPGACLFIDQDTYRALERQGVKFMTRSTELPSDGSKGYARTDCADQVTEVMGISGFAVQHATCAACAGLELRFREAAKSAGSRT